MYYLNKIVGAVLNPIALTLLLVAVGLVLVLRKRKRLGLWAIGVSLAWLWLCATPIMTWVVGASLESEFLVDGRIPTVDVFPSADAIVVLGGGMGADTNLSVYAEMSCCADRVWQAARLYKAGKAPKVIATGFCPQDSTLPLLKDFGVPEESVVAAYARNSEEEAKVVKGLLNRVERVEGKVDGQDVGHVEHQTSNFKLQTTKPKVLLVTSAWHMKRARLMFKKYAPEVEVVCAPADFENTRAVQSFGLDALLPSANTLALNTAALHECIGLAGYKLFR